MQLERIHDGQSPYYDVAFALYEASFPVEERRDAVEQQRVMKKDDYHFDVILDDGKFVGIMLFWETEHFIYLEHFAVLPQLRGHGKGAQALTVLKNKGKTVILEIEPPVDELTNRRYGFYQRNGFLMTPHHHIQPKYHLGDEDLILKILSYPQIISAEEYLRFQDYLTKEVGILPAFSNEVTVREVQKGDDIFQVAKLIYLSDNYIYPNWFDSIEDGAKVISKMIDLPTIYNRNNLHVAVTANGEIAGVVVSCMMPIKEKEEHLVKAFEQAGVKCDQRTHNIFLDYYDKMTDPDGYYVANLTVDPKFRGKGIASTLLSAVIKDKPLCRLECVKANTGAWRLYQRLGFVIVEEYPGVFGVPCYRMVKGEEK